MKKDLLKFITCGSVDDGKSTLIGHLIYQSNLIYVDQAVAIEQIKVGEHIDYSLLLDGLMDERAQGITIDVAYRYFDTKERSFILADTPGHEQYTRNMAVGASFADLAIVLIDATKGVLPQTKRHILISSMMGIKHFVVVINKMDLVGYSLDTYYSIKTSCEEFFKNEKYISLHFIPVSATIGDNVVETSKRTPYYKGPSLYNFLNSIEIGISIDNAEANFILPIQRVTRGENGFRSYQGEVFKGEVRSGQKIEVFPSRQTARVKSIFVGDKLVEKARLTQQVSITFDKELDVVRGDVISANKVTVSSNFKAKLLWITDTPLDINRDYIIKVYTKSSIATVKEIDRIILSSDSTSNNLITTNSLFTAELHTLVPIAIESFENNQLMGGFILIDPISNATSAVGTVIDVKENKFNLYNYDYSINKEFRERQKNQVASTIWITGLSGSGKSYFANQLESYLVQKGYHTMLLDGDNLRQSLNDDLGFDIHDRTLNVLRTAKVAKLMNEAGLVVIVSLISPINNDREEARRIIGFENFIEVYMDTPLEVCISRDSKGLYKRAMRGEIKDFTGISSPYEIPESPDFILNYEESINDYIQGLIDILVSKKRI